MTKLSPGTLLLGVFAVLFGLIGAYAAKQHFRERPQEEEPVAAVPRQMVPLASIDLPADRTITLGDVMLVRMTREDMEKRGLSRDHMTDARQVVGRTLRVPLKRGQVFVTTSFYPEGTGPSLAKRLKPGYRAVTISLEDRAAATGWVSPGSVVDVILRTFANEREEMPETTVTLLDFVEVLAIDQETFEGMRTVSGRRPQARATITVTLAVTPEQASALKVVEGRGTMSLVLRNPEQPQQLAARAGPVTLAGLLNLPKPETPFVTELYRRGQLTTATFSKGQRTMVQEAFRGLPVGLVPVPTVSSATSPTLAVQTSAETPEPCGCEND